MSSTPDLGWQWDPTLFGGSAAYYSQGRVAYPPDLAEMLVRELDLDGTGRLLDVGCGPGSVTLLLAPHYADVIAIDADPDMIEVASSHAARYGLHNISWRHLRGEELTTELAPVRTAVFAQSFHWMERDRVAGLMHELLEVGGTLVHVHATTHRGGTNTEGLLGPQPPYEAIAELVQRYLGAERRAGQGVLRFGTPSGEDEVYRGAGFSGPQRIEVPSWVVDRTVDEVVAAVYSQSGSAPHLFGDRLPAFGDELRGLVASAAGGQVFTERMSPIAIDIWRRAIDR